VAKYRVIVTYTNYGHIGINVEADSEDEARNKAVEEYKKMKGQEVDENFEDSGWNVDPEDEWEIEKWSEQDDDYVFLEEDEEENLGDNVLTRLEEIEQEQKDAARLAEEEVSKKN